MFQVAVSSVVGALLSPIKGLLPTGKPLHLNKTGMRNSSQILIFVNVQKSLDAGIKFYLSANGVVLTEGNSNGFLSPEFFLRVENADRTPAKGWESSEPITSVPADPKIGSVVVDAVKPASLGNQIS